MLLILADDDRESVVVLAELLRYLLPPPIDIVLALDGEQAVAAATRVPRPDVLILDIEMPRMNGLDAAIQIRTALGNPAPLLIAATGHVGMRRIADPIATTMRVLKTQRQRAPLSFISTWCGVRLCCRRSAAVQRRRKAVMRPRRASKARTLFDSNAPN
jgi:CheY-like chemotaxis protein